MTISIELSPAEEARLAEEARRKGVDISSLVRGYVSQPPEKQPASLAASTSGSGLLGNGNSSATRPRIPLTASPEDIERNMQMFARWAEEDAKLTPEEREEDARISAEIEAVLLANPRDLRLRQPE